MFFIGLSTMTISFFYFISFNNSNFHYYLKNGKSDSGRTVLGLTFLSVAFIAAGSTLMEFNAFILLNGAFVFLFMFLLSLYQTFFLFKPSYSLFSAANLGFSIAMINHIIREAVKYFS